MRPPPLTCCKAPSPRHSNRGVCTGYHYSDRNSKLAQNECLFNFWINSTLAIHNHCLYDIACSSSSQLDACILMGRRAPFRPMYRLSMHAEVGSVLLHWLRCKNARGTLPEPGR